MSNLESHFNTESLELLDVEAIQKILGRSRASIYRYANTASDALNPPFDPQRLNPEWRTSADEPLRFHPNEVARFARDVLGVAQVTIKVSESPQTATLVTLQAILAELQHIRELLEKKSQ
ncbi:resolvase [Leptolyngbya sp. FACHB-261]|uniref:resolvase n=1 Tax=Leptolyngbya sp. FACHB-261 TaxID=2692806 RepID=UPI0016834C21|nr:resolvase [Leptolyngbya sp. FACHB-261]MBD2100081.1 resolvase [Leptolyngbya sp. FACHB-261]